MSIVWPFVIFIYLFSFANWGRVTTTAYANYCRPFYLTHLSTFPVRVGGSWSTRRKPTTFGRTLTFTLHTRTGFDLHWESSNLVSRACPFVKGGHSSGEIELIQACDWLTADSTLDFQREFYACLTRAKYKQSIWNFSSKILYFLH
jgi:hypothetical protein